MAWLRENNYLYADLRADTNSDLDQFFLHRLDNCYIAVLNNPRTPPNHSECQILIDGIRTVPQEH
jgi:hypothetical protein